MSVEIDEEYMDELVDYLYEHEVKERPDLFGVDMEALQAIIYLAFLKMERDGILIVR
ncbi:hypothetical protein [Aciduliprofundum sp. MAR08-339]|uniref:hypothetical protein n=1 Tax=Aciduliprofundum sp. (strain MAR08-339) TaxID=673860 RepID=UPI001389EE98